MIIVNRLSIVQIVIIFTWIRALSFNWTSFCTLWLVLGKTVKCKHCILAISLLSSIEKGCNHSFEQTWIPFQQALVDIGCMVRENNFKCCECIFNIISPWKRHVVSFTPIIIPINKRCFGTRLVEISPAVLEKIFKCRLCMLTCSLKYYTYAHLEKRMSYIRTNLIPFLCQVWWKFS